VDPVVVLTQNIKNPRKLFARKSVLDKNSSISGSFLSNFEVSRRFDKRQSSSTTVTEIKDEKVGEYSKGYTKFIKKRSEKRKKHDGGVNEVEALSNIFCSYLFSH
jgi:hypothetical protein